MMCIRTTQPHTPQKNIFEFIRFILFFFSSSFSPLFPPLLPPLLLFLKLMQKSCGSPALLARRGTQGLCRFLLWFKSDRVKWNVEEMYHTFLQRNLAWLYNKRSTEERSNALRAKKPTTSPTFPFLEIKVCALCRSCVCGCSQQFWITINLQQYHKYFYFI